MLFVRPVVVGDAAGFKTYDSPLAAAIAIDAGVAKPPAYVAVAIFPYHVGLGRNYSRVPINPYLNVAQIELGDVQLPQCGAG